MVLEEYFSFERKAWDWNWFSQVKSWYLEYLQGSAIPILFFKYFNFLFISKVKADRHFLPTYVRDVDIF